MMRIAAGGSNGDPVFRQVALNGFSAWASSMRGKFVRSVAVVSATEGQSRRFRVRRDKKPRLS
jgi:hypothetical protein